MQKTKIICTIGPSSDHPHIISKLIQSGMNVARLNMAHSSHSHIESVVKTIRTESKRLNCYVGIMMDLSGPKIRLDLSGITGNEITIEKDHIYQLGFSKMNDIPINIDLTFNHVDSTNAYVKIDDGKLSFKIIKSDKKFLRVKAENDCVIKNNKGVNFPGVELDIPSLTHKDEKDILKAIDLDIDWIALSFVRSSADINSIYKILNNSNAKIPIIAKIEKPEAIENLDSIIEEFQGILIARGDLGVELPLSKLPVLQKNIIEKCRKLKKPVIVATQMLESMIDSNTPTRAEINDVANAVFEESDAVMLSGETAVGEFPIETVKIMKKIISDVENNNVNNNLDKYEIKLDNDSRSAIGDSVKTISKHMHIDGIVVMTESGSTARVVGHFRPSVNIFAFTPHSNICRQMTLLWGVTPIFMSECLTTDDMLINAEKILLKNEYMNKGDTFILTAGIPIGVSGATNMLKIQKIKD